MKTLTSTEECDVLVLGSGIGGKLMTWTSARQGQRAVVVERKYVGGGGSCPNVACLPAKNIIHSAKNAASRHEKRTWPWRECWVTGRYV
jgi:pyruvate/2-oxoglutarate dehydrogenase complex dihydrolipoamide dehydrogenase (E3) component